MRAFFLSAFLAAAAGCAAGVREAPAPPAVSPTAGARDVLVHHCGTCHRSDLPTAVPGALAVFDLSNDLWYRSFSPERAERALDRLRAKDVDPRDLATMEAFVNAAGKP